MQHADVPPNLPSEISSSLLHTLYTGSEDILAARCECLVWFSPICLGAVCQALPFAGAERQQSYDGAMDAYFLPQGCMQGSQTWSLFHQGPSCAHR